MVYNIQLAQREGIGGLLTGDEYAEVIAQAKNLWTGDIFTGTLINGQWCRISGISYPADWEIQFFTRDGVALSDVSRNTYKDKIAGIHFATGALGDTLCWTGSVVKWMNKVSPKKVYMATSWSHLFDTSKYPSNLVFTQRPNLNGDRTYPVDCEVTHLLGITVKHDEIDDTKLNHATPCNWKCFATGTEVLMYNGMVKNIEDIKVGDLVMGHDSTPRKVTRVFSGEDDLYRVKQSLNKDYVVSSKHTVYGKEYKRDSRKSSTYIYTNKFKMEAEELFNKISNVARTRKYRGIKKGWDFADRKTLRLDPWLLGFWLGDGDSKSGVIYPADSEEDCIRRHIEGLGIDISSSKAVIGCKAITLYDIHPYLKMYNIYDNKHIPIEFLRASREDRLKLLAGIIDSDGYYVNRLKGGNNQYEVEFGGCHINLIDDVNYLALSLGFTTYIYNLNKGNFLAKRLVITGRGLEQLPIVLPHKQYKPSNRDTQTRDSILHISYEGRGIYHGFECDGDHLFLLSDGTVVHNCTNMADTENMAMGVELGAIRPHLISLDHKRLHPKPYVTICNYTTQKIKHLLSNAAWMAIIQRVKDFGFDVINVGDKFTTFPDIIEGANPDITVAMRYIRDAEFHVGLSSGLSWLAWAYSKHVLMINNFTHPGYEFTEGNTRILNNTVSHAHFNRMDCEWAPSWEYDPDGDDLEQASRSITPEMILKGFDELMRKRAIGSMEGTYLDVKAGSIFKPITPLLPDKLPLIYTVEGGEVTV